MSEGIGPKSSIADWWKQDQYINTAWPSPYPYHHCRPVRFCPYCGQPIYNWGYQADWTYRPLTISYGGCSH